MSRSPAPSASRVRELPLLPSLEHLKNEAKQRRKALREQDPWAKLADAQLAAMSWPISVERAVMVPVKGALTF